MNRYPGWEQRAVSAREVVSHIESRQKVFVHGAAATPTTLLDAMVERTDLEGVELYHLHLSGPCRFSEPRYRDAFIANPLFTDEGMRKPVEEGRAFFVPVFLSDVPNLFASRRIPLDVALVSLSPPDRHGLCTLGTSIDAAKAATEHATIILAEINEQLPRTYGATVVPFDRVTAFVHTNRPLHEAHAVTIGAVENQIGEHIAALVKDGSTLQMGIGAIPNAVLTRLGNKNDLGVHTEMFSDLLVPLIERGVVTNRYKNVHRGRTVTSFVSGSSALFNFVHDNQLVEFHPCDRTNDTALIRQNPRVVAVNAAIEIDLTGQVCADSIGHRIYSGIGGQMDFIRGAALSEGGKAIIALPSTARNGQISRIVPTLKPGAGVVTTRGHVQFVATEHGIVDLHGLNLKQRAQALISIAHPDFRAELAREIRAVRHFDLGG
ncbi:MAG: acetyl-CoA hydrolase/transferase C-terminal domain-containing protein [Ramlibacter sp.]